MSVRSFDFADATSGLFGLARFELRPEEGTASAIGVLFDHERVVAASRTTAAGPDPSWGSLTVGNMTLVEDEGRVRISLDAEEGGFEVEAVSLRGAAMSGQGGEASGANAALCRVEGAARGVERAGIECLGTSFESAAPDWGQLELIRTLSAGFDDGTLLAVSSARPAEAAGHGDEEIVALLLNPEGQPTSLASTRLSTEYDADGHHRRAGIELWPASDSDEPEPPIRAAARLICGTTLRLDGLRLDTGFFRFSMEGEAGLGRYDVLQREE